MYVFEVVYEVVFFDMKTYIYSESVFNTPYIEMKQIIKKFASENIIDTKNDLFICAEAQGLSLHFRFLFIFIKFIFLFNKVHGFFDFRTS